MPKFSKGNLVVHRYRRLGAEVIDPEPAPGMVKVRIATIDILTGNTSIVEEDMPENELEPVEKKKGVVIM